MDINVRSTDYQGSKKSWYLGTADIPGFTTNARVDVSAFTQGTHFPNGYIPSGTPVGLITASSTADSPVVGPYDNAAVDGRGTFYGFLFDDVRVPDVTDLTKDAGGAVLVAFAPVRLSRLPFALDANGQADNTRLYYV